MWWAWQERREQGEMAAGGIETTLYIINTHTAWRGIGAKTHA